MKIELNCGDCGGNRFALEDADGDDCAVSCQDCGHDIGTLGELEQRMAEEVLNRVSNN